MIKKKFIFSSLYLIVLISCAPIPHSDTAGKSRLGGAYEIKEQEDGSIHIVAQSNPKPWADYEAARGLWRQLANKKCGDKGYIEKEVNEYDYEPIPPYCADFLCLIELKSIATVKQGYVICNENAVN